MRDGRIIGKVVVPAAIACGVLVPIGMARGGIDPRSTGPDGPNSFGPFSWERVVPSP